MDSGAKPVTVLLARWSAGDQSALDALLPLVYTELRDIARRFLSAERPGHTLQSTALVHEAYLRMVDQSPSGIESRMQFFAVAARLMRQILVDHARERQASKRGGGNVITLDESAEIAPKQDLDLLALDDALNELSRLDERQARIVELRFFAGLSIEETSRVLDVSPVTVTRSWTNARLWLQRELVRGSQQ
ncbi:MAG TPA: sigma-70 family RNA polymerase sigma factor [Terriglobia bacterium]|nr:sigma-70 family RNA polymerase sigma factor [Terriglobia bacterium]